MTTSLPKPTLDPIYFDVQDSEHPVKDLFEKYESSVTSDPIAFLRQLDDAVAGRRWRSYENILYPGYYASIMADLLTSPYVRSRIKVLARRKVQEMKLRPGQDKEKLEEKATLALNEVTKKMAGELVAKVENPRLIRVYGAVLQKMLARLYQSGIHVNVEELVKLREVAAVAAKNKRAIIFLPCHKSHIDYLLISWLCFRIGLALPHIVAGNNLNLPVVGPLLRRGGAMFIRRSWGDDELYPVVAKEYISLLLERGHNLECFIEGTRSRSGKLLPPKFGILKDILNAVISDRTTDVLLAPVSIQYDKVIESRSYVEEMMGIPKQPESLSGLLSSSSVLGLKLGRIDVRFQTPYSLKETMAEQTARRLTAVHEGKTETFDIKRNEADKMVFLRYLGFKVLSDINAASVAMPSALVATALLTLRTTRGVSTKDLIRRVEWLIAAIIRRGGRVVHFGGKTVPEMVNRTLQVMKDVIGKKPSNEVIDDTVFPLKPFELSLYRNQTLHLFVSECLFSATLYLQVKKVEASNAMKLTDLISEVKFLSDLLRLEFVFSTQGIEANVRNTMDTLIQERVVSFDNETELVSLSETERLNGRETFDFFCFLVWPFIESYWLAAIALISLLEPKDGSGRQSGYVRWVSEKDLLSHVQLFGKTLFWQGDLSTLESISTFTLQNALQRFAELGLTLRRRVSKAKLVGLDPKVDEDKLNSWADKIGAFRREGKSRRTNAIAAKRVSDLARSVTIPMADLTAWPIVSPVSTKQGSTENVIVNERHTSLHPQVAKL
ncbi:glycerol-3-phosphate acyltransferase [Phaffia rhodozyma]|uniref:Glycerol-3-phosphate acyltransferase n=1 Tax=Phaffia rhodozyma TaxID=264483 RepID=A0A0F7SN64_PHARH|nr:glycerol-3-phosphate acyltransferase [Phaffia rhodozyma]